MCQPHAYFFKVYLQLRDSLLHISCNFLHSNGSVPTQTFLILSVPFSLLTTLPDTRCIRVVLPRLHFKFQVLLCGAPLSINRLIIDLFFTTSHPSSTSVTNSYLRSFCWSRTAIKLAVIGRPHYNSRLSVRLVTV